MGSIGGGIALRNHTRNGSVAKAFGFGCDVLYPTNDEQYVVATTDISDATAANTALTLNASGIVAAGYQLLWPQKLCIVLRNRSTMVSGPPGIPQCSATFAGTDQFVLRVAGLLNGKAQTEDVIVNINTISTPSGSQRSHIYTAQFYDEITSITVLNTEKSGGGVSDFGTVTPLKLSVGLGAAEFGDAMPQRLQSLAPTALQYDSNLRRVAFYDETNYAVGGTAALANINSDTQTMFIPGKLGNFTVMAFAATVSSSTELATKVAHGLTDGMVVMLADIGDGLPALTAPLTRYYIANAAADTFALSTSRQVNNVLTALATDDSQRVFTALSGTCTASTTTDRVTRVAHGLIDTQPIKFTAGTLPTGLVVGTTYYVRDSLADTFKLAATSGGAAIDLTVTEGVNMALSYIPAHGFTTAQPLIVYDTGAGIPAGLAAATVYYAIATDAWTLGFAISAANAAVPTPINITGANVNMGVLGLIDMTTGGLFASGDAVGIMRPKREWQRARLLYSDRATVG